MHLDLSLVTDPAVRARLLSTPLGLTLPTAEIDLLVSWGERLVKENPAIQQFLRGL